MSDNNEFDLEAAAKSLEALEWQSSTEKGDTASDAVQQPATEEQLSNEQEPMEDASEGAPVETDPQEAADLEVTGQPEPCAAAIRSLDELIKKRKAEETADPAGALRARYVFMECLPDPDWDAIYKWQGFLRPNGNNDPFAFVRTYKPHHEFPPEEGRTRADAVLGEHRDLAVEDPHIDERSRIVHLANERQLFWNTRAYIFELGRVVKLKGLSPLAPSSILLDPVPDAEGVPTKAPYLPKTMNLKKAYGTLGMPLEQPLGFLVKTSTDGYWPLERVFIIGGEFESQRPVVKPTEKNKNSDATADAPEKPGPSSDVRAPAEMPPHLLRLRDLEEAFERDAPRREELRRQGIIGGRPDQRKPYGQRQRQRPPYRDPN